MILYLILFFVLLIRLFFVPSSCFSWVMRLYLINSSNVFFTLLFLSLELSCSDFSSPISTVPRIHRPVACVWMPLRYLLCWPAESAVGCHPKYPVMPINGWRQILFEWFISGFIRTHAPYGFCLAGPNEKRSQGTHATAHKNKNKIK